MKSKRIHRTHMSGIVLQQQHGARIPHFDCLVRAATGKAVATRMPHNAVDRVGVIIERMHTSSGSTIPKPDSLVVTAADDQGAVRANEKASSRSRKSSRWKYLAPHRRTANPISVAM
jgi:hypothetical protein